MTRNQFENNENPDDEQEVDITLGGEVVGQGTYNTKTGIITGDISSATGLTINPGAGLSFGVKAKTENTDEIQSVPDPADRYRVTE